MEFILLINVKMPTIFGILTFISMINTTYETLKARFFQHFSLMSSCVEHVKIIYNLGPFSFFELLPLVGL